MQIPDEEDDPIFTVVRHEPPPCFLGDARGEALMVHRKVTPQKACGEGAEKGLFENVSIDSGEPKRRRFKVAAKV